MALITRILLMALFIGASAAVPVNSIDEDLTAQLDTYLSSWHKAGQFNGVVLVAKDGEIIIARGYGLADMAWNIPNTVETKFDIGSIAKQFTTVLVFQLCAEGKISLEDPLNMHIPEYRPETGQKITIDNLLQHTSGIPCFLRDKYELPDGVGAFKLNEEHTSAAMIRDYLCGDLLFEPGSEYRYSNSNYYLLRIIVERATGKTYEEILRERIFIPLEMNNSGLLYPNAIVPRLAHGHQRIAAHYGTAPAYNPTNIHGAGGMFSTCNDLLKWSNALRNNSLLDETWQAKMFASYWKLGPSEYSYSQTLVQTRLPNVAEPVRFYTFNGAIAGFISDVQFYPDSGHTMIFLDNSEEFNYWEIAAGVYSILIGVDPEHPLPSAGDVIAEFCLNSTPEASVIEYARLNGEEANNLDFRAVESEINTYAYRLLDQARNEDAKNLFELNMALFPSSSNAANSMAEYYERTGNDALANAFYKKEKEIRDREARLLELLRNGEYERAKSEIRTLRLSEPSSALFKNQMIGPIFGEAMGTGEIEKAIAIAEVWATGNPDMPGPYFSLAAAYQRAGDINNARKCYEVIIAMNPAGRFAKTARMRLERLEQK